MKAVPVRHAITLVAVFLVIGVSLVVLDNRGSLQPLRGALGSVVDPVGRAFSKVSLGTTDNSNLAQELKQVTAERDQLRAENAKLKSDEDELNTLRQQQKVQEKFPTYTFISARVISSDPSGQQLSITIDKGAADGLQKGMAVTDPNSYVGQITEVTEHSAKVMLIIDTSQSVGAVLNDTRSDGVVYGQWQSGGRLVMKHVNRDAKPKAGEMVVTSDIEETPPELVADIMEHGITLAGGGALLMGLDRRLQSELRMPVHRAEDPLTCVARGTGRVAEALHLYQRALAGGQELRRG